MQARALQLLRESWERNGNQGVIEVRGVEEVLVREAMGRGEEAGEEEGRDVNGGGNGDGDGDGRERRKSGVRVADVAVTERVRELGRRVVRRGVDGVEVVIKPELTDGWVV